MTITYSLIAVTVLVSMYSFNNTKVLAKLINNPYLIDTRKQYYRFLTSGFIHRDHMHLLLNMVTLYFFGGVIEQVFEAIFGQLGGIYFIALYLMAIVISDLPTFYKHRSNPGYSSLGASGGVAAVVFASILLMPLQLICLYFALCMPGFILGTGYLIFSFYRGRKANDSINHDAHLYGALFGFVFCAILYPSSLPHFVEQVLSWRLFD